MDNEHRRPYEMDPILVREALVDEVNDAALAVMSMSMGVSREFRDIPEPPIPEEEEAKDYDFEIVDEMAHWQTRYWKWCTKEEAEDLGASVRAPAPTYQDHEKIDVEAKHEAVESILASAATRSVDLKKFNKGLDMDKLLWKLLRAECYFMKTKDPTTCPSGCGFQVTWHETHCCGKCANGNGHGDRCDRLPMRMKNKSGESSVMLMVETVRLRVIDSGRILLQEADSSLLHSHDGLPGIEKACNQSPVTASKHLWNEILQMPEDVADFIEDIVEDVEFEGYKGIRCIERVHVMAVKMRTSDPSIVCKIGLPEHSDCIIENPQGNDEDQSLKRTLKWVTFKEFVKKGGVLSNLSADVRGKSLVEGQTASQNLVDFLRQGGVEPDTWDAKGDGRKLQLLLTELKTGKCYLEQNSKGLMRVVNIVSIRVWSPDKQFLLVDRGRRNEFGEQNWDAQLPGRKKEKSETLQEVALAMLEIVKLQEEDVNFPDEVAWEYFDYIETSSRFEGLLTKYQKFFVDAILEEDDDLLQRMGLRIID